MVEASVFEVTVKADFAEETVIVVAQNASQAVTAARGLYPDWRVSALEEKYNLAYISNAVTGK